MSKETKTTISEHDDGRWIRTALVISGGESRKGGSVAIVNEVGERIALLNIFTSEDNDWFAIDVIDIEERYSNRRALVFDNGTRQDLQAPTTLIGVDFRKGEK